MYNMLYMLYMFSLLRQSRAMEESSRKQSFDAFCAQVHLQWDFSCFVFPRNGFFPTRKSLSHSLCQGIFSGGKSWRETGGKGTVQSKHNGESGLLVVQRGRLCGWSFQARWLSFIAALPPANFGNHFAVTVLSPFCRRELRGPEGEKIEQRNKQIRNFPCTRSDKLKGRRKFRCEQNFFVNRIVIVKDIDLPTWSTCARAAKFECFDSRNKNKKKRNRVYCRLDLQMHLDTVAPANYRAFFLVLLCRFYSHTSCTVIRTTLKRAQNGCTFFFFMRSSCSFL